MPRNVYGAIAFCIVSIRVPANALTCVLLIDKIPEGTVITLFVISFDTECMDPATRTGGCSVFHVSALYSVPLFEYEFDQPTGTDVHQILWMTYDGEDMDPTSPRSLELNYPDWRDRTGIPEVFLQQSPDLFYVAPVPNATKTDGFRVSVALKPTRSSNNIDTDFSTDYRDGIVFGALWRLLRIPSREWSDARAAADYRNLFDEQVREAEARSRAGALGVRRLVKYKGVGLNPRKRYRRYGF